MATPRESSYEAIAIRELRAQFLAQSPACQAETRDRVRQLLADEQHRQQRQPSYLMQHHKEIYGI